MAPAAARRANPPDIKRETQRPERREPKPIVDMLDPPPQDIPRASLNLVAVELEDSLDGLLRFLSGLDLADKISLSASVGTLLSSLLPWSGKSLGIFIGAGPLWFFVVATLALMLLRQRRLREADEGMVDEESGTMNPGALRRLNLLQILSGLGALAYVAVLGVGLYVANPKLLDLRFGWFIALFMSTGLAYSGIARFVRDALNLRPRPPE